MIRDPFESDRLTFAVPAMRRVRGVFTGHYGRGHGGNSRGYNARSKRQR
jgi:hypothetical protein